MNADYQDEVEISPKVMEGIFSWMDISENPKLAMEKLKSFEILKKSTTLRERKKQASVSKKKKPAKIEPTERSEGTESDGSLEADSYEN